MLVPSVEVICSCLICECKPTQLLDFYTHLQYGETEKHKKEPQRHFKDFKTSPIMYQHGYICHRTEKYPLWRPSFALNFNLYLVIPGSIKKTKVGLTYKKIWYSQIQEVVIALSSQTLVHLKGQNDQCVAQNYHDNQSHHHHHQNDKYGSWKHEAALDSSWGIVKIVPTGVRISFFHRHGPGVRWTMLSLNPQ